MKYISVFILSFCLGIFSFFVYEKEYKKLQKQSKNDHEELIFCEGPDYELEFPEAIKFSFKSDDFEIVQEKEKKLIISHLVYPGEGVLKVTNYPEIKIKTKPCPLDFERQSYTVKKSKEKQNEDDLETLSKNQAILFEQNKKILEKLEHIDETKPKKEIKRESKDCSSCELKTRPIPKATPSPTPTPRPVETKTQTKQFNIHKEHEKFKICLRELNQRFNEECQNKKNNSSFCQKEKWSYNLECTQKVYGY